MFLIKSLNKSKKNSLVLLVLSICLLLFLINIPAVIADGFTLTFDEGKTLQTTTLLGENDPATIAYGIINWALVFLGLITVIMIIISGFMWLFAAGNEERIKKAQGILKGAIMGLLVIMASYGAASYIFTKIADITVQQAPATDDTAASGYDD